MNIIKTSNKKNFIYNSLYQLLTILMPLVVTPYISRVLGAEDIGLYSYSHAIAYYFVMFAMLGLSNYGNRTIAFVRDNKKGLSRKFCEIYIMQLIVSAIVIVCYILYAIFMSNTIMTWIMLIYVVSTAFDISWLFFGLEQFKITAIRSSIIKVLSTVLIFIFVKNQSDVFLYALIMVLGILLNQVVLWMYAFRFVKIESVSKRDVLKHLKPNLLLFVPVIAISLYKMMDKIMLGAMSDLTQVGFYENTEKIIQVPMALIISLGTVMMPRISNLAIKNCHRTNEKYMKKSLLFAVCIASFACFGIMGLAKDFVPWFYGNGFEPCIMLFQILMPSCIFLAVANVVRTQYLIPYKYDGIYVSSVIVGALLNLVINTILIPKMAAGGAAIGTLVAEAGVCLLQLMLVMNKIKISKTLLSSLWFVFSGLLMYAVLVILPDIGGEDFYNLLIKAVLGGAVYLLLLLPFARMRHKKVLR